MNMIRNSKYRLPLAAALLGVTATSCAWMKPADKRIAEKREEISARFLDRLKRVNRGVADESMKADWNTAMERMYLNNPELIRADNQITEARRRQSQIWRNMAPLLSAGISDSFRINEIAEAFASPQLRIYSFLPLRNLVSLPQDMYVAKMQYIGTKLQAEVVMRQQVIQLYLLFQEQRLLMMERGALDVEGHLVESVTELEGPEVMTMRREHEEAVENWELKMKTWKEKVGDFYMTGFDEIVLDYRSLPNITYKPNSLDFTDTGRWGLLQLNLLALEEIAEEARVLDLYRRYFPQVDLGVSAPPLYNSGASSGFEPGDIRLGPSLSWRLDSQGSISTQLKRIKEQEPLKDWSKDKRQRQEITRLVEGKQALAEAQEELAKTRKAMAGYRKVVTDGLVNDPRVAIDTMRMLREREIRFAAREIEISTSFWLIDEQRWTAITKRWLDTREQRAKHRLNR